MQRQVFLRVQQISYAALQKILEMLRCSMHIGVRNSNAVPPAPTSKGSDQ